MENRKYIIFDVSELDKIDFNEVQETSSGTVRKSVDETLTFVKYDSDEIDIIIGKYSKVITTTPFLKTKNLLKIEMK